MDREEIHNLFKQAAEDSDFSKNHKLDRKIIDKHEGNIISPKYSSPY